MTARVIRIEAFSYLLLKGLFICTAARRDCVAQLE